MLGNSSMAASSNSARIESQSKDFSKIMVILLNSAT